MNDFGVFFHHDIILNPPGAPCFATKIHPSLVDPVTGREIPGPKSPDAKNGDVLRWEHIGFLGFLDARLSSATFFRQDSAAPENPHGD